MSLSRCCTMLFVFVLISLGTSSTAVFSAEKNGATTPNIVVILADDVGWGDLSRNEGTIPTPCIDRLFEQGVRMRSFMTNPVCSPTRGAFLTGRHPLRIGAGPQTGGELDLKETTIATTLKKNGYSTGVFGKWHNGSDPATPAFLEHYAAILPDRRPPQGGLGANAHGFDEAWIYYGGGADYFTRMTSQGRGPVSWWHNNNFQKDDEGYTDDLVCDRAVEFIAGNKNKPFFCYVPFHVVHAPHQAKPEELAKVPATITDPEKRVYAAMMMGIDGRIQRILDELEKHGLRENTIVFFFSDNGATPLGSNLPFRGGKHSLYEGGVRSPAVLSWPNGGMTGNREYQGMWGCADLFPTLIDMAGLAMPETRPLDGKNVWPALQNNTPSPVESWYWVWRNHEVVRTPQWKLFRYFDRLELYDIVNDAAETTDVSAKHPNIVAKLVAEADRWRKSTGVALSSQAPKLDEKWLVPAPSGDVLEVRAVQKERVTPANRLTMTIGEGGVNVDAGDYLVYDVCVMEDSEQTDGFACFSIKQNKLVCIGPDNGVDQFGRLLGQMPGVQAGKGQWERRIMGVGPEAPSALGIASVVLGSRKTGSFHLLFDNIGILKSDGTFYPLWESATNKSKFTVPADKDWFDSVQVQVKPLTP